MLLTIFLIMAIGVVILVLVVATRPSGFHVARSTTISAPSAVVFDQVNDLHKWAAWSPWEKLDPNAQKTYEGPAAGMGASYAWLGNKQMGQGRMTITESRPSDLVRMRLEFIRPFAATNAVEFAFVPEGASTVVTWSMKGTNNFMMKAMGLFMSMDKMCGDSFEEGLATLKAVSESAAR